MRKRLFDLAKLLISASLLAFVLSRVGLQDTFDKLRSADAALLLTALGLFIFGVFLRAFRWRALLSGGAPGFVSADAAQAGLVLKNVGLTSELLARLEDLRGSRQRLVAAQDEERRRLERNLHDGAQQNLVALKVKLGLAEMFAERDPARAKATLAELKADTDEALETLRDLARGIYPPLLADQGLVAALAAHCSC